MQKRFIVALDLAKRTHVARILDTETGKMSQAIKITVNQEGFESFDQILATYSTTPADFLVGCEATGHYGETLLRRLQNQGYAIVRLNPAQVVQFRRGLGRKAKTDALDAEAMARQLAVTQSQPDQAVDQTQRSLQRMTRLRLDFVEEQGRWINRVRGLLNQVFPELEEVLTKLTQPMSLKLLAQFPSPQSLQKVSLTDLTQAVRQASRGQKGEKFAQKLKTAAENSVGLTDPCLQTELQLTLQQLMTVTDHIKRLEQEIIALTDQWLQEYSQALALETPLTIKSFPYGSHLSLGTILAELGSLQRFSSLKHLLSYFGWCPNTQESGQSHSPHPPMSHQGNRFMRRVVWMLAVGVIRAVPEYQAYYQKRQEAGKNPMKTMVAVGRKLLSVIYAILRTGVPYDPKRHLKSA